MNVPELARLRWRCRRGMLELDLLFERFLAHGYAALDAAGRRRFAEVLLKLPDQELHDYLLGLAEPEDRDVAELVRRIRAAQD